MAIKFAVNGQAVECESADDAAAILTAMGGVKKRPIGRPAKRGRVAERAVMLPNVRALLLTLKEFHPNEVSMPNLAMRLNKSPKSLPPIITALGNWARKARLDPRNLVVRKTRLDKGKPVSAYVITEEGIDVIQKELSNNP
jgi:hypothetical protein